MLPADLTFNIAMCMVDFLTILWINSLQKRNSPAMFIFTVFGCYALLALGAALITKHEFQLRHFGTFRFIGMALFWHLPVVLALLLRTFRRQAPLFLALILILVGTYVYAYHVEPHRLEISNHDYTNPLLKGLSRAIVIAQISDVQTDQVGPFEQLVFAKLSELRPDMIVYTGDYLHCWDRKAYQEQAPRMRQVMSDAGLRPPLGSYAVLGDSDDPTLWKTIFEGQQVQILEDQAMALSLPGVKVNLIGLRQWTSRSTDYLQMRRAFLNTNGNLLNIVVGHSPDFVQALAQQDKPFLALAGHTHGGQVQIPFFGPPLTLTRLDRKYADCFTSYGPGVLSVSRGIGMERFDAPRLRFLCRPEIRLIHINPQ